MAIYLSPSMLSIDFTKVGEQLAIVEQAGVPYIHLDVMDGVFVPNISFGIPVIQGIRKASNMVFDAHLMIVDPERYVEQFRKAGADITCGNHQTFPERCGYGIGYDRRTRFWRPEIYGRSGA